MTRPREGTQALSPWWRHATILVMIAGFSVLTYVTVLTYNNAPPIPGRVVDAAGTTLFDRPAILRGQETFLKYGLMEHGSLWGHGAYLGPDYSAEYLHRLAEICIEENARGETGVPGSSGGDTGAAAGGAAAAGAAAAGAAASGASVDDQD